MPLTDQTTNTTQPQGPTHAGNGGPRPPGLTWQRPVFTAPVPRSAPGNATSGRIPGIVMSRRPRWTPEKHARILARIHASRTDVMPALPEVVEEALDTAHPAVVDGSWAEALGQLAERTKSCFYSLTVGALDALQRSMPAGGGWPLPGAAAAQPADPGEAPQSRAEGADPTCALNPTGAMHLNRLTARFGQDFDIAVSASLPAHPDAPLSGVLIVVGDAEHFNAGMTQLIADVLRDAFGPDDLLFAEAPAGQPVREYLCHGVPPQRCIGIDDPEVLAQLQSLETAYFSASKAAINLVRDELPEAQRDALVPPLGPEFTVADISQRTGEIGRLIGKGRIHIPPKKAPEIARQIQASTRHFEALGKLVTDPAKYKARDVHMVKALRSAVDSGQLRGRKGFVVIGQGHLSNIKATLLKQLPCIVLEQKKFRQLPPHTWPGGQRITY